MMRRNISLFLFSILSISFLAACSFNTDNVSGDGNLEGFWHLERIEYLSTDAAGATTVSSVSDLSNQLIFWSFQQKLLELSDKLDESRGALLCRFTANDGHLTIDNVYIPSYDTDSLSTDVSLLAPFGMDQLNKTYSYTIHGSKLTLTGSDRRLFFTRF